MGGNGGNGGNNNGNNANGGNNNSGDFSGNGGIAVGNNGNGGNGGNAVGGEYFQSSFTASSASCTTEVSNIRLGCGFVFTSAAYIVDKIGSKRS